MADINNLVEELSKLTVLEAAELVKSLEAKWGVTAAAPVNPDGNALVKGALRNAGLFTTRSWYAPLLSCAHTPVAPAPCAAVSSWATEPPPKTANGGSA